VGKGADAIAQLSKDHFDIVLADYNLGSGKNGQQLLEEAKYKKLIGYATVWMMVTAEKTMEMVIAAAEYQPDDYLIKPFNQTLLVSRLEKLLEKKSALAGIDAALEKRDPMKALVLCDELLAENKVNAHELLKLKSSICLSIGDYAAARAVVERVLAERPVPWAKTGLGRILFHERDFAGARQLFAEVVQEHPSYLDAYDWLGKTLVELGENRQAQDVLVQAAKLSPNSMSRQRKIGELARKNQDMQTADVAYAKAIKLSDNSVFRSASLFTDRAAVLLESHNAAEAARLLEATRKEFKGQPEALLRTAALQVRVYQETGEADKSQAALRDMESQLGVLGAAVPHEVSMDISRAFIRAGQKDKAMALLGQVVKNNEGAPGIIDGVRALFDGENLAQEGGALIDVSIGEVVRINDEGVLLARVGKYDEAIELLRKAHEALPENTRFLLNLAGMLIARMQASGADQALWQEAQGYLEQVRKIDPAKPKCLEYVRLLDGLRGQVS
jgi:tetratricopeptide (TPR) repeat protein